MSQTTPTGDTAKVYSGIRDVPIYAGETSPGNRLPGGPYRRCELIAIAAITIPTIWWVRTHVDSGYALPVLWAEPDWPSPSPPHCGSFSPSGAPH